MASASVAAHLTRCNEIRARLRVLNDQHPDGNLGADADEYQKLDQELTTREAAATREINLNEAERRAGVTPVTGNADTSYDELAGSVLLLDCVRAQLGMTDARATRARELSAAITQRSGREPTGLWFDMRGGRQPDQRALSVSTPPTGPGSSLVQTTVSPTMIGMLQERIIVRGLGCTVFNGLVSNISIPAETAEPVVTWVLDNTALQQTDMAVGAISGTPKHVGSYLEISRQVAQQSNPDISRFVEQRLAGRIARGIDRSALVGGGSAAEPKGLLAPGSGITIVPLGTTGAVPSWNSIVDLIASVDQSNALAGSLSFATNAKAVAKMRKTLKTAADTSSSFLMETGTSLAGYPLVSSQLVPSDLVKSTGTNLSALIFGDWSQLALCFWSEIDILVSPYTSPAFERGGVMIRAMATADVMILQPKGFAAITDMVTT